MIAFGGEVQRAVSLCRSPATAWGILTAREAAAKERQAHIDRKRRAIQEAKEQAERPGSCARLLRHPRFENCFDTGAFGERFVVLLKEKSP